MNMVSVKINGVEYNLKGEEQIEYLNKVAKYADKKIKNIMDKNCMLNTSSAAVLSAINIVDDLFKSQAECIRISEYANELENKNKQFAQQIEELKSQLKHLALNNSELLEQIEESINKELYLEKQNELNLMKDAEKKYVENNNILKGQNKELKFQLYSSKYKVMDLENKLMESQINYAKEKKLNNSPFTK